MTPHDGLLDEARDLLDGAIALRRDLHRHPELGNHLPDTRNRILEALDGLPLDVQLHESTSGIAATLTGDTPGPTVLLRADMDALPMPEDTGVDYSSTVDNVMHACGHDTHVSMLVGAARLLAARRGDIAGRVLFMFQPGEEGHHGARYMLDEGLLDLPPLPNGDPSPVSGAFAMHITANIPMGMVAGKGGAQMASADTLRIVVHGRGGHASEPHRALDPIPIACEIVQALQSFVTRRLDAFDPGIVTVARITAGTTNNVIPETAEILGTIRAVSERTRSTIHDGIRRIAEGIAEAHEGGATVEIDQGYPVTVNDPNFADFSLGVGERLLGDRRVLRMPHPIMGAEDFSYVLNRVQGSMLFLGATPAGVDPQKAPANHSNRVMFDEQAMVTGMAMYTAVALDHLGGGTA